MEKASCKSTTWIHIRTHTHLPPNTTSPMYNYPIYKRKTHWLYNYQMWTKNSCPFKSLATFPSHTLSASEQTPKQYGACCLKCLTANNHIKSTSWGQSNVSNARAGGRGGENGLISCFLFQHGPVCYCYRRNKIQFPTTNLFCFTSTDCQLQWELTHLNPTTS